STSKHKCRHAIGIGFAGDLQQDESDTEEMSKLQNTGGRFQRELVGVGSLSLLLEVKEEIPFDRQSEINKVFECPFQRLMPCPDDSPLVGFRSFGNFFHGPLHIGQEKGNRLADA